MGLLVISSINVYNLLQCLILALMQPVSTMEPACRNQKTFLVSVLQDTRVNSVNRVTVQFAINVQMLIKKLFVLTFSMSRC